MMIPGVVIGDNEQERRQVVEKRCENAREMSCDCLGFKY